MNPPTMRVAIVVPTAAMAVGIAMAVGKLVNQSIILVRPGRVAFTIVSRWEDGKLPSVTNQRKLIALLNPETKAVSNGN